MPVARRRWPLPKYGVKHRHSRHGRHIPRDRTRKPRRYADFPRWCCDDPVTIPPGIFGKTNEATFAPGLSRADGYAKAEAAQMRRQALDVSREAIAALRPRLFLLRGIV